MTNTTLNISSDNTAMDTAQDIATAQDNGNNTVSTVWQFIDYHGLTPSMKVQYFSELAKYRASNPLFELNKREERTWTPDENFNKECEASSKYRIAKGKGVILVSQDW